MATSWSTHAGARTLRGKCVHSGNVANVSDPANAEFVNAGALAAGTNGFQLVIPDLRYAGFLL